MIYKLQLSTKEYITITEEEKQKFENNLDKNFIKLGDRIINPSFVVSIVVDKEATREAQRENVKLPVMKKDYKEIKFFLRKFKPNF